LQQFLLDVLQFPFQLLKFDDAVTDFSQFRGTEFKAFADLITLRQMDIRQADHLRNLIQALAQTLATQNKFSTGPVPLVVNPLIAGASLGANQPLLFLISDRSRADIQGAGQLRYAEAIRMGLGRGQASDLRGRKDGPFVRKPESKRSAHPRHRERIEGAQFKNFWMDKRSS
jgi:hypothetical protein